MGLSENLTEIKSEVEALTTYANETTGAADTTLSGAVASLIAGYGGGGSTYPFLPVGAELIHTDNVVWNLAADTSYNSITPSTTSQVIKTQGATRGWYEITPDFYTYEYQLLYSINVDPKYDVDLASGYFKNISVVYNSIVSYRIVSGLGKASIITGNGPFTSYMASIINTTTMSNYGINPSQPVMTFASAASRTGKFGIAFPQINVRAHSAYASLDCFSHLIADQTTITLKLEVYRYPKENGMGNKFDNMLEA